MSTKKFHGSITALITPFKDGAVDHEAFESFVAWQIEQGTHGLVPCGTTGESPTLSDEEDHDVIARCVRVAKGRVPVIAGCGTNDTRHVTRLVQSAEKAGADAALIVTPYYNKPTQEGLYQHYKAIHDETGLPIIVYVVPGRCVVNMTIDTLARLAELPRIVGIKDATGDLGRPVKTRAACGPDFIQLSGNDDTALPFLVQGGHGCISVVSNVAPKLCADMHNAWTQGDIATAQRLNMLQSPLADALFVETSPGPVKYACSLLGHGRNELRLPLVPVTKATEKAVQDAMAHAKIALPPQAKVA